jgi:4-phytase/acid phosphatase
MTRAALSVAAALVWISAAEAQPRNSAQLRYAVIVTRHGVRAPTWTPERLNRYSATPWPDFGVPPGHLTPHGRLLMKIMGNFYREYFASEGLLGKANCADAGRTYLWADTDQRTMETGRALSESLLAGCKGEVHALAEGVSDPLFNPLEAKVFKQDARLGHAAVVGRIGPKLDAVVEAHRTAFDELVRVLTGGGRAASSIFDQPIALSEGEEGVQMTGPLNIASTFTENLLLEYTNGMRGSDLGWGRLNASNLLQILSLHTAYADLMRRTPYLAQVRGSNLLNRILRSMEQAATGKRVKGAMGTPETALLVISGHDTNLSNLSGMLGLSWAIASHQPDDIPPGGALMFSLWRAPESGKYTVRLQFVAQTLDQMHNAKPLSLKDPPPIADVFVPGCSTADPGWACDWRRFQATALAAINPAFVQ